MSAAAPLAADRKKSPGPPPSTAGAERNESRASGGTLAGDAISGERTSAQSAGQESSAAAVTPTGGRQATATGSLQRFNRMAVRAKLAASHPRDSAEQEADHVAGQVARSPRPTPAATENAPGELAQRAGAEAASTSEQPDPLALKRVPAAENGHRRAAPDSAARHKRIDKEEAVTPPFGIGESIGPQREADQPMGGRAVTADTEQRIVALLGSGKPLPGTVELDMATRFNQDFSGVCIHDDSEAAGLCAETSAHAFTVGNDIFFATGRFAPETDAGRELLAHELTHVVQQKLSTLSLQRVDTPAAGGEASEPGPVAVSDLPIPTFKFASGRYQSAASAGSLVRAREYDRSERANRTYQAETWDREVSSAALVTKLRDIVGMNQPDHTYTALAKPRDASNQQPVGDAAAIARGLLRPWWTRDLQRSEHQVDHILELQLTGWPRVRDFDQLSNYELVDERSNTSAGPEISRALEAAVGAAVPGESARDVMAERDVMVSSVSDSGTLAGASRWTRNREEGSGTAGIEEGAHIDVLPDNHAADSPVEFWDLNDPAAHGYFSAPPTSLNRDKLTGSSSKFVIYYGHSGGAKTSIDFSAAPEDQASPLITAAEGSTVRGLFLPGFRVREVQFNRKVRPDLPRARRADPVGVLRVQIFASVRDGGHLVASVPEVEWPIQSMATSDFAGYLDTGALRIRRDELMLTAMSPLQIDTLDLNEEEGLVARGKVLPTLPLFRDADIDIVLAGDDIRIEKYFSLDELSLPSPIRMDTCSLGVSLGLTSGLQLSGEVGFGIERLGTGSFSGTVRTTGEVPAIELEGEFNFDSSLFDRATVQAWYRDEQFGASGEIGIDSPEKIRGIRSANLNMQFEEGQLTATGSVIPDIPGVQEAGLRLTYSEAEGLLIGGNLQLAENPAIRSGSVEASVRKQENVWRVSATGTAVPALPGVSSTISLTYDDGAFDGRVGVDYAQSIFSGNVTVGVTNRAVSADGEVEGGAAAAGGAASPASATTDRLSIYGSGTLNARLTDWLQGGVGLRIRPTGDILISGQIGIAEPITVFEQYPPPARAERTLFSMPTVSVPLVGVSVGSTVIGVALTVGGRVTAHAYVGPGRLTQTELRLEDFNPAQPDSLHITGDAEFNLPAEAGVGVSLDAGVSVGAAIIRATAGISAGADAIGRLDITPRADLDWRPASGLHLHGDLNTTLTPLLAFHVSGFAEVVANAFVTEFSLWRQDYELARLEIGSNLGIGVNVPVDYYSDGRGVVFDPNAVSFDVPPLDASLLEQLLDRGSGGGGGSSEAARESSVDPSTATSGGTSTVPMRDEEGRIVTSMDELMCMMEETSLSSEPGIDDQVCSMDEAPVSGEPALEDQICLTDDLSFSSAPGAEDQVCSLDDEAFSTEPNQSLMPKRWDGGEPTVPHSVDENLIGQLGMGVPLDLSTRGYFEQRMQADLSRVQIHVGRGAAREADKLVARAFTMGEHIAFAAGEYQPNTPEGQELIAHELAHVAQQQGGGDPIVLRWPAVTRTSAQTAETPASIRAMSLSGFSLLTETQLDWATSPALQADAAALGQFRDLQTFADGPSILNACGDLNMGQIIARGVPAVYPALRKYTNGATSGGTAWLRRTDDTIKAERWGLALATLEAAWPAANLSLVMRAPDPVAGPSPFEKLENPASPELPNFISYLTTCTPILSANDGSEVDSFLALRGEGAMPTSYLATVSHVKDYHHFTRKTLDGLVSNEAFPQWKQQWAMFQRPLTVVLYPAVDHNGAFHRNLGLQGMVTNSDILTIVVEGHASVSDYQAELPAIASRYGIKGEISQAMIAGHGNSTVLELAGTAGAAIAGDRLGTTGAAGTNTTDLMTELTRLMSGDPRRRRIVLDACLTNSHHVASALRASPADAAADVNAAVAADPSLRDVVAGMAGAGANVFGSNSSFAPAQTTFMTPGSTDIGLSVPGDPDLIGSKLQYIEFGTEPEGCMRAVLECWATDQLAGTHDCRDAIRRRIAAGQSTHVAGANTWRESIIQPLYELTVNHYWGNGEAIRRIGTLAGSVFELYWPGHTTATSLHTSLGALAGNAAHIDRLLARVSAEPHYAATPRVAMVIEQAWMQHSPARRAQFLTAFGRYGTCLEAAADVNMALVMAHVPLLLTVPPAVPPPADQLRLALLATHHAPAGTPPPAPLPTHIAFLDALLGAGPSFPAALRISAVLGGLTGESDILTAIGRPLAAPRAARSPLAPPPDANIDTVRDATARNDFRVTPLRANGVVATVRDDLLVRRTPTTATGANIFNRLATGSSVFVIGEYGNWYAIEQPAATGFVAKRYITLVP